MGGLSMSMCKDLSEQELHEKLNGSRAALIHK